DSLTERVVMTGGVVEHNAYMVEMTAEIIGRPVLLCEHPQLVGAMGAALYARDERLSASAATETQSNRGE
ncbi:MAG: FGGY-family carbohydrate kinase, partial [Sterolibacterium sp.]